MEIGGNVCSIIEKHYNEKIYDIELLGSGWGSTVFLMNNKDCLRLTGSDDIRYKMRRYYQIQNDIIIPNIEIPKYNFIGDINFDKYRYFAIYPFIKGDTLCPNIESDDIMKELSNILYNIHRSVIKNHTLKTYTTSIFYNEYQRFISVVRTRIPAEHCKQVENIGITYINLGSSNTVPRFCHKDFAPKNVIINSNKISGIIDWDEICYCDPLYNFNPFEPKVFNKMAEDYPNKEFLGENIHIRYKFYRVYQALSSLYHVIMGYKSSNKGIENYLNYLVNVLNE